MDFKAALERIVHRCEGVKAVILMDMDGVPIETVSRDADLDVENLGVEYARIVSETRKMSANLESGAMTEMDIATDRGMVVMRIIGEEYFLAVVMDWSANHGKGRYLARMAEFQLLPELT